MEQVMYTRDVFIWTWRQIQIVILKLQVDLLILEEYKMGYIMEKEYYSDQMEIDIRVSSEMVKKMEEEN